MHSTGLRATSGDLQRRRQWCLLKYLRNPWEAGIGHVVGYFGHVSGGTKGLGHQFSLGRGFKPVIALPDGRGWRTIGHGPQQFDEPCRASIENSGQWMSSSSSPPPPPSVPCRAKNTWDQCSSTGGCRMMGLGVRSSFGWQSKNVTNGGCLSHSGICFQNCAKRFETNG